MVIGGKSITAMLQQAENSDSPLKAQESGEEILIMLWRNTYEVDLRIKPCT